MWLGETNEILYLLAESLTAGRESLHSYIFQCFCQKNEAFATDAIVDPPLPFKG